MEPLMEAPWWQTLATVANRIGAEAAQQAKTVAVGCDRFAVAL
jgi:hypothetical protein